MADTPSPKEITRANKDDIKIIWRDGHESVYTPFYMRTNCQCASCVDENTGKKVLNVKTVDPGVHPLNISPVGRYAIHITWSDGHTSGIFSFEYLRKLCPCETCTQTRKQ